MPQYSINPQFKQPAYLQLYNQLREDITRGLCPYGSRLPSKRFLAAETGTSVITVQHAYDLLADEGYIESRERSGYFVSYKENELFPVAAMTEESAAELSELTDVHEISDIPIRGPVVTPEQEQFPFNTLAWQKSHEKYCPIMGSRLWCGLPTAELSFCARRSPSIWRAAAG